MNVFLSPGGANVFRSGQPLDELKIATQDGLVSAKRAERGGTWQVTGRALEGKHVSALIEPADDLLLAGTYGDGLYVSRDGGSTLQRTDKGLEPGEIYSLASVEVSGKLKLYAGTEPARLFVSTDRAASWQELPNLRHVPSVDKWTFPGPPHVAHVKHIAFDPVTPDTIYASIEVGGLLQSDDAGQTWRELSGFYEDVHRLIIPPSERRRMYISGGDGIYHSEDGGDTWDHMTDRSWRIGYPDGLVVHPEQPALMFTSGAVNSPGAWHKTHTADSRIARSRDGGTSWDILHQGLPEHIRGNTEALSINLWPGGFALFVATTDGDVFFSQDEGESWSTIISGLAPISKGGHFVPLTGPERREPAGVS